MKNCQQLFLLLTCGILFGNPFLLDAQNYLIDEAKDILFWEAPSIDGKKVTHVKEWRHSRGEQAVNLASTHSFRLDGLLGRYQSAANQWLISYKNGNHLYFVDHHTAFDTTIYSFAFLENRDVMEKRTEDKIWKTIFYKDDRQRLAERKEFYYDSQEEGIHYRLLKRTVYTYDLRDSLIGEMQYIHHADGNFDKNKLIHDHGPKKDKKINIFYYEEKKQTQVKRLFYDDEDRLIATKLLANHGAATSFEEKTIHYKNKEIHKKENKYFDRSTPPQLQFMETRIYTEGLLIYLKVSDSKGFLYESNFQYLMD